MLRKKNKTTNKNESINRLHVKMQNKRQNRRWAIIHVFCCSFIIIPSCFLIFFCQRLYCMYYIVYFVVIIVAFLPFLLRLSYKKYISRHFYYSKIKFVMSKTNLKEKNEEHKIFRRNNFYFEI